MVHLRLDCKKLCDHSFFSFDPLDLPRFRDNGQDRFSPEQGLDVCKTLDR